MVAAHEKSKKRYEADRGSTEINWTWEKANQERRLPHLEPTWVGVWRLYRSQEKIKVIKKRRRNSPFTGVEKTRSVIKSSSHVYSGTNQLQRNFENGRSLTGNWREQYKNPISF